MILTITPLGKGGETVIRTQAVPTINLVAKGSASGSLTYSAVSGPRGERGERGPAGPVGTIDGEDFPDFTLIFENKLI